MQRRGKPAAPRKVPRADDALVTALESAAADLPDVRRGSMFGCPAVLAGGRVFACVFGDRLALKLPAKRVEALRTEPGFASFAPMDGPPMTEWVAVERSRALALPAQPQLLHEAAAFARGS